MIDHGISVFFMLWIALCSFIISTHCDCGSPPSIPYGILKEEFINQDFFKTGTTVQYNCRLGFIPVLGTRNTVTCMDISQWTIPDTFCTLISCAYPGDLENGEFEIEQNPKYVTGFKFGTKVIYYCNEGFRMVSQRNYRICQADRTWSNAIPHCEVVSCPHPKSISSGSFIPVKEEYNYMDAIQYKCDNPKFGLYGKNSAFCRANGTWSSDPPSCRVVDCPNPEVPNASKISGFAPPYTLNSGIMFECFDGFNMIGSRYVQCNIHSQWEPSLPYCQRTFCEIPPIINGYINKGKNPTFFHNNKGIGYQVYSSITMKCNFYFTLKGEKTITCGGDFKWHPEIPICEKWFGCSSPNILNGQVIRKNGEYYSPGRDGHGFSTSDTIEVQCDNGYALLGSNTSECERDMLKYVWSPDLPQCQ
ncbi:membrane cofactor protein-like [Mixophyes fleayi]|uniref:membrane cofactor protein-like n=1 Tax=Mixophyes fleayi TaxID=3061075 RepID=UPI003F4D9C4F